MDFGVLQYLIPVIFAYYGYKLRIKHPAYMDERGGFPTGRAKENEEIWNCVQGIAGNVCFVMAALLAVVACVVALGFPDSAIAAWVQIGIEVACMVALIPIVNAITDKKFPPKKRK